MNENQTTQSKSKLRTYVLGGILALCLLCTYGFLDFIYPKAPKNFEFIGTLSNAQLVNGQETFPLNEDMFHKIQIHLYQAKPTRKMSANDHPDVGNYYKIDFESDFDQFSQRLYLYEYGGQVYFEIPYCGIYKTDQAVLSLLQGMI